MEELIKTAKTILIQSGEGEIGVFEIYTGKRTTESIYSKLSRKRRGGRWARAWMSRGYDDVYDEIMSGDDTRTIHDCWIDY